MTYTVSSGTLNSSIPYHTNKTNKQTIWGHLIRQHNCRQLTDRECNLLEIGFPMSWCGTPNPSSAYSHSWAGLTAFSRETEWRPQVGWLTERLYTSREGVMPHWGCHPVYPQRNWFLAVTSIHLQIVTSTSILRPLIAAVTGSPSR